MCTQSQPLHKNLGNGETNEKKIRCPKRSGSAKTKKKQTPKNFRSGKRKAERTDPLPHRGVFSLARKLNIAIASASSLHRPHRPVVPIRVTRSPRRQRSHATVTVKMPCPISSFDPVTISYAWPCSAGSLIRKTKQKTRARETNTKREPKAC